MLLSDNSTVSIKRVVLALCLLTLGGVLSASVPSEWLFEKVTAEQRLRGKVINQIEANDRELTITTTDGTIFIFRPEVKVHYDMFPHCEVWSRNGEKFEVGSHK